MVDEDLLARATRLVAIPSVSRAEQDLADVVEQELRSRTGLDVQRIGDSVVARSSGGHPTRILLAGHLDTVPPSGNQVPRVDGDTLWGVGAVDMKGGLAVLLDLVASPSPRKTDVTYLFYACEEVERSANALGQLATTHPELLSADAAVLLEPTGGQVEAGCQGTMRVEVVLTGKRAHTARPWTGKNAVHRLAPLLDRISGFPPRQVELDGCTYLEQLQAVGVEGGIAGNVVPDQAVLTVNHRFAPDRDIPEATAWLREFLAPVLDDAAGDTLRVVDAAGGAPPALGHPVLAALVEASGTAPRAKVGWTDVATLWDLGIPATNFGPGDPLLAHSPDEHVTRSALQEVRRALGALLGETAEETR
jgi:succinyl-diaminopimelate desuccinylase